MFYRLKAIIKAFCKASKQGDGAIEDVSHLHLLVSLQAEGRLLDFLKEDINNYTDEQVGAAARKLHSDCSRYLEKNLGIRPIIELAEGESIAIPEGYNQKEISIVGHVRGKPPFRGTVIHRGWRVQKASRGVSAILYPAEVEIVSL